MSELKKYYCKKCNKLIAIGWNELTKTNCRQTCNNCNTNKVDWSTITLSEFKDGKTTSNYHGRLRQLSRTVYNNSNKPKQCIKCGYSKHYQVCHIKDVKNFSMDSLVSIVNDINNLVALCPNCHWEFDNGLLIL